MRTLGACELTKDNSWRDIAKPKAQGHELVDNRNRSDIAEPKAPEAADRNSTLTGLPPQGLNSRCL